MEAELQAVRAIVEAASLPESVRHTAAWCLDKLPPLYREFLNTFDQRHGDEIRRHVQAMLHQLDARLAEAVAGRFRAMHERLGLPALALTHPKQPRKRKAG
jgi:hypothetical protein